jgi:hypothetical protein
MRIACIHIPQYALQCATRLDPSLRGAAIAMASASDSTARGGSGVGVLHAPVIVACSRAAWALGVRLGMTATAARSTAPDVSVVSVDAASERETVRAIADGVLGLTPIVDAGGRVGAGGAHLAMYAEVPQKTRGSTFGERVIERLSQLGLTGRVGIADDRFTAWVAAAYGTEGARSHDDQGTVTMVPRGGSAAFLAPRPLSLLAISSEVQHMLEALGVRTLGEFASLPAPSVARPLEADYRALARGESGSHLRPYAPEAAIREELVVAAGTVLDSTEAVGGPTAIALIARRIALRLEGRARGAARVELTAVGNRGETIAAITPDLAALDVGHSIAAAQAELPSYIEPRTTPSISSAEDLARAFAPILDALPDAAAAAAWRLRVTVVGESITTINELDLAVTTELAMPVRTQDVVMLAAPVAVHHRAVGSSAALVASSSAAAGAGSGSGAVIASTSALGTQPHRAAEPRVPRSTHNLNARAANTNGASDVANSNHYGAGELNTSTPGAADPLAVVLSTSGALFALQPNEPDRAAREHRRTRRGKQRRSRSMTAPLQARLFDRRG